MAKIKPQKNTSKKEVIIKKAAHLFKIRGFAATGMRELADVIGMEAPSLYNYIGSKSELLYSVCFKIARVFINHLDEVERTEDDSIKKMKSVIRFHIRMMLKNFDEVYVANHEWKHLKEPYLSEFLTLRRNYEKRMIAIAEKGMKKGEIKKGQPKIIIFTLLSAVRGLELWHRNKKNISDSTLENNMIALLTTGFINK